MALSGKPLVLCADDYAFSVGVSAAIVTLAEAGRVSATSAMVLSPRWRADAKRLAGCRGRLDVGLHLDWTSPFARAAGHGMSLRAAMARAVLGGFDRRRARVVIERQLDLFEAAWGAPPDHVDGHQHVQQFAGLREALVEVLAQRYPGRLPWLRISRAPAAQRGFKTRVIAALGASRLERLAASAGIATAPALAGIYAFDADSASYGRKMADWLKNSPAGSEVMCHPGLRASGDSADSPDSPADEIAAARWREYEYLASEAFGAQLQSLGVRLARGSVLYRQARVSA